MMAKILSQSGPGEKFITPSKIITQSKAQLFCVTTGNTLGRFLSDEAARAKGWDRMITPGALSFSVTIGLIVAAGILDDGPAFLGTDDLRFVAPIYIGDTLHVEAELLEKSLPQAGERGTLRYKWRTLNQNGKEVARDINACMIKLGFLEAEKSRSLPGVPGSTFLDKGLSTAPIRAWNPGRGRPFGLLSKYPLPAR